MIAKSSITHFRCLQQVEVSFSPLTAIVGPNSSGKSTLLRALAPAVALTHKDVWKHRSDREIRIIHTLESGAENRTLLNAGTAHPTHSGARFIYQLLRLDLKQMRRSNLVTSETILSTDAFNLPNVFATLSRPKQDKIAAEVCRLVPMFRDVDVRPDKESAQGNQILLFQDKWNSGTWYTPKEVSDGTILLTAFLTLQYQGSPVDVLAIEEPERGLHPYLIGELIELLRKLSRGELGSKPIQVVLATHSPELLNFLRPEEVRFLKFGKEGAVTVEEAPTKSPDWEKAFKEYRESLGSVWLSGGLGGVPGSVR